MCGEMLKEFTRNFIRQARTANKRLQQIWLFPSRSSPGNRQRKVSLGIPKNKRTKDLLYCHDMPKAQKLHAHLCSTTNFRSQTAGNGDHTESTIEASIHSIASATTTEHPRRFWKPAIWSRKMCSTSSGPCKEAPRNKSYCCKAKPLWQSNRQ